jgi:hypothetical protein
VDRLALGFTIRSSDAEADFPDSPGSESFSKIFKDARLPGSIQFIMDRRLEDADIENAVAQAFRAGVGGQEISDKLPPCGEHLSFFEPVSQPQALEHLGHRLTDRAAAILSRGLGIPAQFADCLLSNPSVHFRMKPIKIAVDGRDISGVHESKPPCFFRRTGVWGNLVKNLEIRGLFAVVADCLDRAAVHGFLAQLGFFVVLRLFVDVGMPTVVVSREVGGGRLPAKVAVDALIVDVKLSSDVFRILVRYISHGLV